ncbi:MAG: RsmB/NOP family class I SAM-dependent RNA methyltransferase [Candidatus Lokiarchaeota archaeon]|nr:RsmB/NOP family class I SAM-dependent RNA methyltransferase [Candidatus Lokiarchaeota archaeon]
MIEPQNQNSIKKLFNSLCSFSKQEINSIDVKLKSDSFIYHYYYEIVRYWNKINFIVRKNIRFIKEDYKLKQDELPIFFFSTYRIMWENASIFSIFRELEFYFKSEKEKYKFKIFQLFLNGLKTFSLSKALKDKELIEKTSIELGTPSFLIKKISEYMEFSFLKKNLEVMNNVRRGDYTLWFNLKMIQKDNNYDLEFIKQDLKKKGIKISEDIQIPYLYHVKNKSEIIQSKWYIKGYVTFQDKASVIVIEILSPNNNDLLFDMCAGPGMKTNLIAQKVNNNTKILAIEFDKKRMKETNKILNYYNIKTIHLLNADSIDPPFNNKIKFDKIILDPPCTGSGTFRANPELKWRQNYSFLNQNIILQEKLLNSAIKLLKPGGILVYSTCSLYAEEGELQILKLFDKLLPLKLPDLIDSSYKINNEFIPGTGRLYPATHGTQGFFIAKFRKKESGI